MSMNKVSAPLAMTTPEGKSAYRLVTVKSRSKPHKANLKDDYQKIQEVALSEKQGKALSDWIKKKQKSIYININSEYSYCTILKHWSKSE